MDHEIPVRLSWVVGKNSCKENLEQRNFTNSSYACGRNTECVDHDMGYLCRCSRGYRGNPYLLNGCKDIDECRTSTKLCPKGAVCKNMPGNFSCICPTGYHPDATRENGCVRDRPQVPLATIVSLGIVFGTSLVVILISTILCGWRLRKRRQAKARELFFKRNGGFLLQQQIASQKGAIGKTKIFVTEELERATDNFNASRIHGNGGFGSVYKGMLADGRIVGIKRAHVVNENQVSQFINEVVILSQINHRNIVKLLGSCLETEVPLLIFEFVSNGTLSYHLHDEGHVSSLSWESRFRIALDIAGALAYLHSAAYTSIFHRDVKSTNILLDENYRAIVADFGISRSIPTDRTHLTREVHGTFGYLDPEYFQSNQFTEKSDVYSFGVVLVELLTGEKAVSSIKFEEEKNLVMNFISAVKENRLFQILEARVAMEAKKDEVSEFAKLARRCLKLNGKKRPTMKEVVIELEKLRT
ncbi:wall-associated receptor kinase-like 9 [Pistacia vera]|uniref:wall-associated receptor kinase-like 9 n=1 Tax=Pistacia vera TaxID=55513 RepID=UPI001262B3F6|nr:wall-associated receptor kinase-like 9 [Pistacia vera]